MQDPDMVDIVDLHSMLVGEQDPDMVDIVDLRSVLVAYQCL